jgi:bifunctional DNA-binding transcriptional regulator/antitoxin component of YhaV-PrlF toxin-antitoxin module
MNPVFIAYGKMNKRGQVTIPKTIRCAFEGTFSTQGSISLEIKLMPNGKIVLVPFTNLPVSLFMKSDPELAQSVARAYTNRGSENFASEEQVDNLLKE